MATTTALLGVLTTTTPTLIAAAILARTARGVFTLLQATAVTDRRGPRPPPGTREHAEPA
jgi:hypothetical protein